MFHKSAKLFVLGLCAPLLLTTITSAQTITEQNTSSIKENIPYTRFGIGDLKNNQVLPLRGMGGVATAYANDFSANPDNPASYAFLKLVSYQAGFQGSSSTLRTNQATYRTGTASVGYINISMPIARNRAGLSLGLKPMSSVYYRLSDTMEISGLGKNALITSGEGGINEVYIGGAYRFGGFSIGANVGYLFGTIRNSNSLANLSDSIQALNSDFTRLSRYGGIYWSAGAIYTTKLNKELSLRLGATAKLAQQVNVYKDEYATAILTRTDGTISYDTSYAATDFKGKVQLPLSYGAGVHLVHEKWTIGLDYTAANWADYRSYGNADSTTNTYKIALGGEYTPAANNMFAYFQRVTYRLGFYYGKDYYRLHNTDINYYAFTVGASLPFRRAQDRVHTALEFGRRGTQDNGLIQQGFFRLSLGLSLNSKWFEKRRYD